MKSGRKDNIRKRKNAFFALLAAGLIFFNMMPMEALAAVTATVGEDSGSSTATPVTLKEADGDSVTWTKTTTGGLKILYVVGSDTYNFKTKAIENPTVFDISATGNELLNSSTAQVIPVLKIDDLPVTIDTTQFEWWLFDPTMVIYGDTSTNNPTIIPLRAVFKTHNITYDLDGGTNSAANPATYTYSVGLASLEPASKDGYTFDGWFTDAARTVPVGSPVIGATETDDKVFYAKFTAIPVPEPEPEPEPEPQPEPQPEPEPEPVRAPKTGDGANIATYMIMTSLIAGIALTAYGAAQKRRKR